MAIVTMAEARERLPELIGLMTAGEKVVIEDGGKWVATLCAPPEMPLTPDEEAARRANVKEGIKAMARMWIEEGQDIPPDSPLGKLLTERS